MPNGTTHILFVLVSLVLLSMASVMSVFDALLGSPSVEKPTQVLYQVIEFDLPRSSRYFGKRLF